MTHRSRNLVLATLAVGAAGAVSVLVAAGSRAPAAAQPGPSAGAAVPDATVAPYQTELLHLAFEAASALPLDPHTKTRSKLQEAVVDACLELDQPNRALAYAEKIHDWRRGTAYADVAFHCAKRGAVADARLHLASARRVAAEHAADPDAQEWRTDRIHVGVARTLAWLGDTAEARRLEAGVVDSESGRLAAVEAMRAGADAFDERLRELDAVFAAGNFDRTRNAIEACAQLFDRFHGEEDRRARILASVRRAGEKLPAQVRIESAMRFAGVALDHGNRAQSLALVNEAREILRGGKWLPEHRIPLASRLAALRHRAGETVEARRETGAEWAAFATERDRIVDIWRAGAIRPLAEAYQAMGDAQAARTVYRRAIEEGVANLNSRPRAEDLVATCVSMAVHAVEPDAALRSRLSEVREGLGHPW